MDIGFMMATSSFSLSHWPPREENIMGVMISNPITNDRGKPNQSFSYFLFQKLPKELQVRILEYAVKEIDAIVPSQVKEHANTFFPKPALGYNAISKVMASKVSSLAAVNLSFVSKEMYSLVSSSHMFYRINTFEFPTHKSMTTYLSAITPGRLAAIRSMNIIFKPFFTHWDHAATAYGLLASCSSLEVLNIQIHIDSWHPSIIKNPLSIPGFKELLLGVQGVKNISYTIKYVHGPYSNRRKFDSEAAALAEGMSVQNAIIPKILEASEKGRDSCSPRLTSKLLQKGLKAANLDIDGIGRMGEDRKPGIVSSRTRQGIRNSQRIDAYGTIRHLQANKYDLNGELAWYSYEVVGARESFDGVYGVEFLVKPFEFGLEKSWENLAALDSGKARCAIVAFYRYHAEAYGKDIVLDVWKLGGGGGEEFDRENNQKKRMVGELKRLITRHAEAKRYQAEMALKIEAAARAAKAAITDHDGNENGEHTRITHS